MHACVGIGAAVGLGLLLPSVLSAAEAARRTFDIPAGDAAATLKQFASQSGAQLLYSPDDVSGVPTQAIRGEFIPFVALAQMLVGTPLKARQDDKTRAIAITAPSPSRAPPANAPTPPPDTPRNPEPKSLNSPAVKSRTLLSFLASWLITSAVADAQTVLRPSASSEEAVVLSPFTEVGQIAGVIEARGDVRSGESGKFAENHRGVTAGREITEHQCGGDASVSQARFAAQNLRITEDMFAPVHGGET